jgi:hypothetical protein
MVKRSLKGVHAKQVRGLELLDATRQDLRVSGRLKRNKCEPQERSET